ncbi:MAG: DNA repair protein RadC [Prevotellaceae bacterium]|jgi:DNA repair protein RadC|nr:DNA repair protein RadC [Prevotellaceae bacterium]
MEQRLTIRQWAEDDRPREKMLRKGISSLSDAELLAILIASGNRNETAVELARRILHDSGDNLNELAKLSVNDLCKKYNGVGEAKAVTIVAALELGNRRKTHLIPERKSIRSSASLYEVFEPYLIDLNHEEFWALLLNNALQTLEVKKLTQGGTNQTTVDVMLLLKTAIEKSAVALAVAHNHPSGQLKPSNSDKEITRKIKAGCDAVGIRFIDHIIVAQGGYFSFVDEGMI